MKIRSVFQRYKPNCGKIGIAEFAGLKNAGLENDGRSRRGWNLQDWKMIGILEKDGLQIVK